MEGYVDEEESEKARAAAPAHDLGAPDKAECEMHMIMHMPYRAWCLWCVTGHARDQQHRRAND